MCYSFRYKHRTKKNVSYGHQFSSKSRSSLNLPPPLFDRRACPGEGGGVGFEPDLAGVGNLNR